jgi:hypothetical protein
MTTIRTLGRNKPFSYSGTIESGVVIHHDTLKIPVDELVFTEALRHFAGQTVKGGFNLTKTPLGGFGNWLVTESRRLNQRPLEAKNASHVAAILRHEAGVESFNRNGVWLVFPAPTSINP